MELVEQRLNPPSPVVEHQLDDEMKPWALTQYLDKYSWKDDDGEPTEVWLDTAYRVVRHVLGALNYTDADREFQELVDLIANRKFIPGGRYLAQSGRPFHQVNNCFLYNCGDSREAWFEELLPKCGMALSTGGGVGVVYSDVRPNGSRLNKTGGIATGPCTPVQMVNDLARRILGGGNRRSAIWGGLHWNHPDIFEWIKQKDWSRQIEEAKAADPDFPAPLDMTNISVILDDLFFEAFHDPEHEEHAHAQEVYYRSCAHMTLKGDPGFSIDVGDNAGEHLRNACTEITSRDDSDVCNLGSINMARIYSQEEFEHVVDLATLFLIAGTVYSDVPHDGVKQVRERNRRLGLGLMGVHEWLLVRGYRYEMVDELRDWLSCYTKSGEYANKWADKFHLSHPIATRAIAPTGTIGIIGETTTSAEPIFCVAYKRKWVDEDGKRPYQYVIDPAADRLIKEQGFKPDEIEDAYLLSYNVERRIKFQAELQAYVDHGISSTINLPYPITDAREARDFADTLIKYLPKLRGITAYPNGARAHQPLEPCTYEEAVGKVGVTFDDGTSACKSGVCGT